MRTPLTRHCLRVCSKSRPTVLHSFLPRPEAVVRPEALPASIPLWSAVRHASLAVAYEAIPAEELDEIAHDRSTNNPGSIRQQPVFREAAWTSLSNDEGHGPSRLTVKSVHTDSPRQWVEQLQHRARLEGHDGAWAVFQALRKRGMDLPTEGQEAKQLWEPILAAAQQLGKMQELWKYVTHLHRRRGKVYDNLYALDIAYWLRKDRGHAVRMHEHYEESGMPLSDGFHRLIDSLPLTDDTSPSLRKLYVHTTIRDAYDTIMSRLYHQRMFHQASLWHDLLMERNDLPTTADAIRPLLQKWKTTGRIKRCQEALDALRQAGVSFVDELEQNIIGASEKVKSGPAVQVKTSFVKDDFCARAFATKAFTPSFVIRSMSTFGVRSIGPLSLRELALRLRDMLRSFKPEESDYHGTLAREINFHIQQLKEADIQLQPCKYITVISRLAAEDQGQFLEATILSDQHPDVYEDEPLLRKLLEVCIRERDYLESQRLLTVLSIAHAQTSTWAWNELLKYYIEERASTESRKLDHVLTTMRKLQVPFTASSVRHSYFRLLRPFKPGKRPLNTYKERRRLDTVVRMWMEALQSGCHIPAVSWNYIIRRYGMTMRFHRLERLCLWLAHFYRPSGGRIETARRASKDQLSQVFPPSQQRAIVEWYFKSMLISAKSRTALIGKESIPYPMDHERRHANNLLGVQHVEPFARGLAILRVLAQNGLKIDHRVVRNAVTNRLRILFGAGRSKLKANSIAAASHPYTLQYMVRCVQDVWAPIGIPLHAPPLLLEDVDPDSPWRRRGVEDRLKKEVLGDVMGTRLPPRGMDPTRRRPGIRYRWSKAMSSRLRMMSKLGRGTRRQRLERPLQM